MLKIRILCVLAVGGFAFALVGGDIAVADENAEKNAEKSADKSKAEKAGAREKAAATKYPSPVTVLQAVVKNLARAKGYRTKVSIEGGFADRPDHEVTKRVVKEEYQGDVFGTLMHMPEEKAYRTQKDGAVYLDGMWRKILSDRRTVRIDRLFKFPEVILARALKHAPQGAQWIESSIPSEAEETISEPPADEPAAAKKSSEKRDIPRGRTAVAKKDQGSQEGARKAALPRIMWVEAPAEEALTHIIEVQNSNCFGVG